MFDMGIISICKTDHPHETSNQSHDRSKVLRNVNILITNKGNKLFNGINCSVFMDKLLAISYGGTQINCMPMKVSNEL